MIIRFVCIFVVGFVVVVLRHYYFNSCNVHPCLFVFSLVLSSYLLTLDCLFLVHFVYRFIAASAETSNTNIEMSVFSDIIDFAFNNFLHYKKLRPIISFAFTNCSTNLNVIYLRHICPSTKKTTTTK